MLAGIYTESLWSLGWMPEEIELEFHSKDVSDFQMSRLVRASLRKYNVPITAFISDAMIADDTCFGVSFDHSKHDDAYHRADGSILITGKIQSARKEGRFWLLETQDGNYVIASFKRGLGRASFLKLLESADHF